jgi:hypothetical protein
VVGALLNAKEPLVGIKNFNFSINADQVSDSQGKSMEEERLYPRILEF